MTHPERFRFVLAGLALLAPVLAGACGGSGAKSDSPTPCTSGVLMRIPLPSTTAAMAAPTVQVCRNGTSCYTSTFPPLSGALNDGPPQQSMSDTVQMMGTLWLNSDRSVTLEIEWRFDDESLLQNGDRYVVTLADGTGVATTVLDTPATYERSAPGVADSGPTCLQAVLTPQ